MKKNRKKLIAMIAACVCLVGVMVGGTLAYLTDTESATNTFTVGSVDINLIESKLHRVNAGQEAVDGRLSTADVIKEGAAGSAPEDAYGWAGTFFTDEQIQADAAGYQDYLAEEGAGLVPGQNVMKCPYVINEGNSDAYVRVRVLIPAVLDNGILSSSMYTGTALEHAATLAVTENKEVDGIVYNEYAFTYVDPLAPGQMTFWNCWGDIKIAENATSEQLAQLIEDGVIEDDGSFGVLVQADAIQAAGFDSAEAAFAAF